MLWSGQDSSPSSQYDDVDYKTEHVLRRERLAASDSIDRLDLQTNFQSHVRQLALIVKVHDVLFNMISERNIF